MITVVTILTPPIHKTTAIICMTLASVKYSILNFVCALANIILVLSENEFVLVEIKGDF